MYIAYLSLSTYCIIILFSYKLLLLVVQCIKSYEINLLENRKESPFTNFMRKKIVASVIIVIGVNQIIVKCCCRPLSSCLL